MKIPCLIISYNRKTFLQRQLEYLLPHPRLQIIIIDNNSTYEPLLEFYEEIANDCIIHRCDKNYGNKVVWNLGLSKTYANDEPYIVTDSDILLDYVKSDWLEILEQGLEKYTNYVKVGLGLNLSRIPHNYKRRAEVIAHERKTLHRKSIGSIIYYECPVDTTLALYRGGFHQYNIWNSLRTYKPYEATHLEWHITTPDDEMMFYFEATKNKDFVHWKA